MRSPQILVGVLSLSALTMLPTKVIADQFRCDFDGYEAMGAHGILTRKAMPTYGANFGMAYEGTQDIHETLRAAASTLHLPPDRTPLVMGNLSTGEVFTFYCAAETCTDEEILIDALLACRDVLGSGQCLPYAIRVDGELICLVHPRLSVD